MQLEEYHLYSHPDLTLTQTSDSTRHMVIMGDMFDSEIPEKTNSDILQDISSQVHKFIDVFPAIRRYAGCFSLLYVDGHDAIIVNDARALREIYYFTRDNQIVCGSQPHLIAKHGIPEVGITNNVEVQKFYRRELWDSRWVGEETLFSDVRHLLPNHYLDIQKREAVRYWPRELRKQLDLKEAVDKSGAFLRGIMKAIVCRHRIMMAVTAGTDSRTLLAASRGMEDRIYLFVNNHGLVHTDPDIAVPREMCREIGAEFHVHQVSNEVDDEFRQLFLSSTFLASERLLPSIYNVFFKNHQDKVLVLGVGEIGRSFYGKELRKQYGYRMAYKLGYRNSQYAIEQCARMLPEMQEVAEEFGVGVLELLYWEQRLGNWGGVRNTESAVAVEKIDPYNSHMLYEILMSVDARYRSYRDTPCVLFKEIIRSMWPELLRWPINPAGTVRDRVTGFLGAVGAFELLKEARYLANYAGYRIRSNWR